MTLYPSKLLSAGLLSLAVLFSNTAFAAAKAVIDSPEQAIEGDSVTFDGSRSHGTTLSYDWDVDGTISLNSVSSITVAQGFSVGEHVIRLTVTEQAPATGQTILIANTVKIITILPVNTVNVAPKATFLIKVAITPGGTPVVVDPATTIFKTTDIITFESTSFNAGQAKINNSWDFGDSRNLALNKPNPPVVQFPPQDHVVYGGGDATPLTTQTHQFRAKGDYVITLASQVNYPDNIDKKSLTGTFQQTITVAGPDIKPIQNINVIYDTYCTECHGKVTAGNIVLPFIHTNLAGITYTSADFIKAYQDPLMQTAYFLNPAEEADMIAYLQTLRPPALAEDTRNGKQLYIDQCLICHGTGEGGYASNVMVMNEMGGTLLNTNAAIAAVPEMQNMPYKNLQLQGQLQLIVDFLTNPNYVPGVASLDPQKAPLPQPTLGTDLYYMYCTYCHGPGGIGGAFASEPIANVSAEVIWDEIIEDDDDNKMGLLKNYLNIEEIRLIANTL